MSGNGHPIELSKHTRFTMPGALIIAIIGITGTAIVKYMEVIATQTAHETEIMGASLRLNDHELRIRVLEATEQRIDANMQQIREWMQEDRQARARSAAFSGSGTRLPFGIGLDLVAAPAPNGKGMGIFGQKPGEKFPHVLEIR